MLPGEKRHNGGVTTEPADSTPEVPPDRPLTPLYRAAKGNGAVTVLSAAMLAVGEILEPEKANVEMVQPSHASDDDGLDLRFGDLPDIG